MRRNGVPWLRAFGWRMPRSEARCPNCRASTAGSPNLARSASSDFSERGQRTSSAPPSGFSKARSDSFPLRQCRQPPDRRMPQPPLRAPDAVHHHPPLALLHRGTHVLPRLAAAFELAAEFPPRLPGAPDADQEQNDRGNDEGLHNSLLSDPVCGKGKGPRPDMIEQARKVRKVLRPQRDPNWGMLRGPSGAANGAREATPHAPAAADSPSPKRGSPPTPPGRT